MRGILLHLVTIGTITALRLSWASGGVCGRRSIQERHRARLGRRMRVIGERVTHSFGATGMGAIAHCLGDVCVLL